MTDQLKLFPHCMPYNTGYYSADNHEIYYEESGNPSGKPALFLHGGPGGGGDINVRRFFDPKIYRIITFDQRGCGRSKPNGLLINNTTWDLISDIEALRLMFDIDKWLVFGGSWGSTLALAYSQTHPSSVSEMILRGIFLLRKKELKWFYQEGASNIFPEAWQNFIELIEPSNRHDLMQAYYDIFQSDNENLKLKAAIAWSKWEGTTCSLSYDESRVDQFSDPHFALAFALIENHYFINRGFFETEDQLINGISKIRSIPTVIVQGRYDMVCPMETAWEVSRNWSPGIGLKHHLLLHHFLDTLLLKKK